MIRIYNDVTVEYQNETDYLQSNVVYLITFPNGKYYVGSTTMRLTTRIISRIQNAITACNQHLISFAIREFMKFDVKILDNESDKIKLRKLEEFYTIEYKSNEEEFGYNFNCGCVPKFTDETRLKMSKSNGHPFFDDFNNYFRSIPHAAGHYNCGRSFILYLLKSGKKSKKIGTGFHYLKSI